MLGLVNPSLSELQASFAAFLHRHWSMVWQNKQPPAAFLGLAIGQLYSKSLKSLAQSSNSVE